MRMRPWLTCAGGQHATTRAAATGVLLLLAGAPAASAEVTYERVALTGDAVPGTPPGVTYGPVIDSPTINNSGEVAFRAFLAGTGISSTNDAAILTGAAQNLRLAARDGAAAPGGGSYTFLFTPTIDEAGRVAFTSWLTGSAFTNYGLHAGPVGNLVTVARTGQAAPGIPGGVRYDTIGNGMPGTSDLHAGQLGYQAILEDRTSVFYAGAPASPAIVLRTNAQAPGFASGVTIWSLALDTASSTEFHGLPPGGPMHAATLARIQGPGVNQNNDEVLYAGPVTAVVPVARTGDAAPGTDSTYWDVMRPTMSAGGTLAYFARFTGGTLNPSNGFAIYGGSPSDPRILVRGGDPAPGLPGLTIAFQDTATTEQRPRLNDAGHLLFYSSLQAAGATMPNGNAVFAGPASDLRVVMRSGDVAPIDGAGVKYVFSREFEINNEDQVAFLAGLWDTGSSTSDFGLFFNDPLLGTTLIAREGDSFDVGGGDLRTIADGGIGFSTPRDGDDALKALTDDGRVAFSLNFTDGTTGLFVATVPEPAAAAGAFALLTIAGGRARRRRGPNA